MSEGKSSAPDSWRGWLNFALVSAIFFQITAATFTSLGVALPFMIDELSWSWSGAGLGFSILSFMVGIASRLPAWTMAKFGTRATFAIGGLTMATGHGCMATTTGLNQYLFGAALSGLGYSLCALVPGVAVIQSWLPRRRSFAIGAYMMIGGLGGVAGPLIVTGVIAASGSWRMHWYFMAASIVSLAVLAAVFLKNPDTRSAQQDSSMAAAEKHSATVYVTRVEWRFDDIVRSPPFYIIVAAMTMTLFGGVTTNSWAVTHMGNLGIAVAFAAGALSVHALINSSSRAIGGLLATRIDPKWLLASALAAEAIGMLALAVADNTTAIVVFVLGEGYGFGMCMFASTVLLINYYGPKESPRSIGTMYLIATIAMLGPVLGGYVADTVGGFSGVFRVYALAMAACLIAIVLMKPPKPAGDSNDQLSNAGRPDNS